VLRLENGFEYLCMYAPGVLTDLPALGHSGLGLPKSLLHFFPLLIKVKQ
jgi:hypothetical protein